MATGRQTRTGQPGAGRPSPTNKSWDEAVATGWTVVSMKEDWKVIYPLRR